MANQEVDLIVKKAFAIMGSSLGEESDGEKTENQSLLAMEEIAKYDFLALVAITDLEDDENLCQSKDTIMVLMAGINSEEDEDHDKHSNTLMAGTDSDENEDNDKQSKVSFH